MARKPSINLDDMKDQVKLVQYARQFERSFWPEDKELQKVIAHQLVKWSEQETSVDIDDFFKSKNIGPFKFYAACENDPWLNECLEIAYTNIGTHIRKNIQDSYDFNMRMYPHYNSLLRKDKKEKLEAAKQKPADTNIKLQVDRG